MKYSFYIPSILFILSLCCLSCSEKYETIAGASSIFATHSSSTKTVGQTTEIRVFTEEGTEVTQESLIFVNDELIEGNSFTKEEVGFYEVKASYVNLEASTLIVEYQAEGEKNYRKRVLVEDYTGTWCGWCPRVSHAMKLVKNISDDVVFIAIHRAPVGTADPYNYLNAGELEAMINTPGYPKGFINRTHQWRFPEPFNIHQVLEFTQGSNPKLGLALTSSLSDNTIDVDVQVEFAQDFQNLKLIVQLLENGLVYPQVNYTDYYEGENPIPAYVHDYTLRQTLTHILGDEIPASASKSNNNWSKNISINLPEAIENNNKIDLIAFVVNESNEVVNVRLAKLGEEQSFEYLDE
jgi:hypothetical protein